MARIANNKEEYRSLFAVTGNQCAFPGCNHPLIDEDGSTFVAQICHIKAALPGGQRFDPSMTDNERKSIRNLIILCYRHHKITDNTDRFPVASLQEMKRAHESRFISGNFEVPNKTLDKIVKEQTEFFEKIEIFNTDWLEKFFLAVPVELKKDQIFHVNKISQELDFLFSAIDSIDEFMENLNNKIIDHLEKIGYDTDLYNSIRYFENPFFYPLWDTRNLAIPNTKLKIVVEISAIKLNALYQQLEKEPENIKTRHEIEKIKSKLIDLSKSAGFLD